MQDHVIKFKSIIIWKGRAEEIKSKQPSEGTTLQSQNRKNTDDNLIVDPKEGFVLIWVNGEKKKTKEMRVQSF